MTGTLVTATESEIFYPIEDGKPLAESPEHFQVILNTFTVLAQYLQGQKAVVMSNQFLFYIQNNPRARVAPDVMVIFDVEHSDRQNYKIWSEGETPKVVFEMTSPSTRSEDTGFKYGIYKQMGVEEYWLFDPKGEWIPEKLRGYRLQDIVIAGTEETFYQPIQDGISQALQLRLQVEDKLIGFYRLSNGEKLPIPNELLETVETQKVVIETQKVAIATQEAELEAERSARIIAEEERIAAEEARIAAETEAQQEKLRIQQAIPKLRELGLSGEQIAEILGSTVAAIKNII